MSQALRTSPADCWPNPAPNPASTPGLGRWPTCTNPRINSCTKPCTKPCINSCTKPCINSWPRPGANLQQRSSPGRCCRVVLRRLSPVFSGSTLGLDMDEKIEFVIEKGVPLPALVPPRASQRTERLAALRSALRSALLAMEVGDSVFVPTFSVNPVSGEAGGWKSYYPSIFTSRSVEGGHRVWRSG